MSTDFLSNVFDCIDSGDVVSLRQTLSLASARDLQQCLVSIPQQPSPLEMSISNGVPDAVAALLQLGMPAASDQRPYSRTAWNAWTIRCMRKPLDDQPAQIEIFHHLIAAGVGKDLVGVCYGPAHKAIQSFPQQPEIVLPLLDALVEQGFGLDEVDEVGGTPLLLACEHFNAPIIEHLLVAGANPNVITAGKRSAMVALFKAVSDQGPCLPDVLPEIMNCARLLKAHGYEMARLDQDRERADLQEAGSRQAWGQMLAMFEQEALEQQTALALPPGRQSRQRL